MISAAARRARELAGRLNRIARELEEDELPDERRAAHEAAVSAVALTLSDRAGLSPELYRRKWLHLQLTRAIEQGKRLLSKNRTRRPPEYVDNLAGVQTDMLIASVRGKDPELGSKLARRRVLLLGTIGAAIQHRGGRGHRIQVKRADLVADLFAALGMGATFETIRRTR